MLSALFKLGLALMGDRTRTRAKEVIEEALVLFRTDGETSPAAGYYQRLMTTQMYLRRHSRCWPYRDRASKHRRSAV
jgi:hypothetical protein